MKKGGILFGLVSGLVLLCHVAAARPNIIYINADDLGVMDVGFNNPVYKTPNIDRLRAEGMLFTDAYAPAANCAPSRAACMSGQYSPRTGVYTVGNSDRGRTEQRKIVPINNTLHLELDNLTMAGALQANGYKTIHLGKWHVGDDPLQQGFDVNIGGDKSGSPAGGYFVPFKKGSMAHYDSQYSVGTHRSEIFADEAIKFLKENRKDPFFMHMAYYLVHTPIQKVPGLVEKYEGIENLNAPYASMVEKMDESIGRILAELEDLGLKDNTLVLFCSDNGGICKISKQTPYRSGKGSYFEGGIREPLVVRWPGKIKPNSTCNVPVIGTDFYPTFLETAGLPIPGNKVLDGTSLMPLLTRSGSFPDRTLFWHFPIYLQAYAGIEDDSHDPLFRTRPGSALRQGNWKLHEYFEDGRLELYDLDADISERVNLAAIHPETAARLHRLLKQWRTEMNAPVPAELNPEYDPNAKPTKKQKGRKKK
jgi:arylsulfatase A-like enzyme